MSVGAKRWRWWDEMCDVGSNCGASTRSHPQAQPGLPRVSRFCCRLCCGWTAAAMRPRPPRSRSRSPRSAGGMFVRLCVRACVCACVRVCVRVCVYMFERFCVSVYRCVFFVCVDVLCRSLPFVCVFARSTAPPLSVCCFCSMPPIECLARAVCP
jgi:hypothetical protein